MPLGQLAKEEGISVATVARWRAEARAKGQFLPDANAGPEGWTSEDKLAAVIETASLNEAELAALIDWEFFEREWAGFFPSTTGRPATSPRLVAGLLYLQHAFRLSDEAVVARWVGNPYFQRRPPIDPTSLIRCPHQPVADRTLTLRRATTAAR